MKRHHLKSSTKYNNGNNYVKRCTFLAPTGFNGSSVWVQVTKYVVLSTEFHCKRCGLFWVWFFFPPDYWLEMMRLRVTSLLLTDTSGWSAVVGPCTPSLCGITVGRDMLSEQCLLAHGQWDVCGVFQIKILPSVWNQKRLIEDPKQLVPLKYNWISALCADWIAVLSRWVVVQAVLSHIMLKYVFIVEQFHVA